MTLLPLPELFTPATAATWNGTMLANADQLKLRTTAWQPGGVTRTIFAVMANLFQTEDVAISIIAQSGFLDYAATGSVTYTDSTGALVTVQVTPDPSIPAQNPTGALGALDVLADSVYDVLRILATFAGGELGILNTSGSTYGPFVAGTYHVAQPSAPGSPSYSNTASLTIPPSTLVASVIAATNASPIAITTGAPHGLSTGDKVFLTGVTGNTAANGVWIITVTGGSNFTLNGSAGNGAYAGGGSVYLPTLASFTADSIGSTSDATDPNLVTQPVTSLVGVSVANTEAWLGSDIESNTALASRCRLKLQSLSPNGPKGAYQFFALSSQQLAPKLTPPLAVATAITKALVQVDILTGTVTVTLANSQGAPTTGPGSDTEATDAVIQAYCVPEAVTAITQAAVEHSIVIAATVWVPPGYAAAMVPVVEVAIRAYFSLHPIGGVSDVAGPAPNTNMVPIEGIVGAIFVACRAANIPIQDAEVLLDGLGLNVALLLTPVPEVATIFTLTVVAGVPA